MQPLRQVVGCRKWENEKENEEEEENKNAKSTGCSTGGGVIELTGGFRISCFSKC